MEKYILSTKNVPNVTVDKYVIMPNHIHVVIFVVAVGDAALGVPQGHGVMQGDTVMGL